MLNRDDALNLLNVALSYSAADQTEVTLSTYEHGLTRLAGSAIHQNIVTADARVRVRAVLGKRIGVAASNRLDAGDLRKLVDRAIGIARVSEPNPDFVSLPPPAEIKQIPEPALDTGDFSPEARAAAAQALVGDASRSGVQAAGHVSTTMNALAVGNSLGVRAYQQWAESSVMAIMTQSDASGYGYWSGRTLAEAKTSDISSPAIEKCLRGQQPISLSPGKYTVILEPAAVGEIVSILAWIGLGATAFQEERSFMSGKIGEQLVGESISLRDDAYHTQIIHQAFDYEGVPKQVVPFFERGIACGVVYDSFTAGRAGKCSTGHALPAPNPQGPFPWHLVLESGRTPRAQLVSGIERGLLVTRFHYVNVVHPKETILTGMTRDGTFLIENGTIVQPVQNMRFTQSILQSFSQVTGIEDHLTLINQEGTYCLVPSLRIGEFSFTS